MAFDPDQFLNETAPAASTPAASSFNPDQFLKETEPSIGKMESFGRGAANNFPLMPQAIASNESFKQAHPTLDKVAQGAEMMMPLATPFIEGAKAFGGQNYSQNLEDWNQKAAEAKKANPVSYGAGAVGGALAPAFVPGIGQALSAAPFMGNAALGAANAVSNEDLTKNPMNLAKEAGEGALIGGTVGKVAEALFPAAQTLQKAAGAKGLASTGIGSKYLESMKPEEFEAAKDFVMKNNLIGTNKEEILQKALGMQKNLGEQIGHIGKTLDSAGIRANKDEIINAADILQKKAVENAGYENPDLRKLAVWHNKGANDILNKLREDPSWSNIQKMKQAYGKIAFTDTGEVKNEASKDVYFSLRDMLKNLTQRAQENPNLPNEYKQALAGYHTIDPVIEGLQKAVGAERAGTGGHAAGHGFLSKLIRSLPGQDKPAVNLGTAALATLVSPHLGPLMALPTLTNPAIQSKAFSALGRNLPGIRQGITQELSDYLESRYGKRAQ